ncbi:HAD family hydrolase [Lusitaniella coriacea]|uniref:HAD family hydrolase n=1 Tax=Lusitaniella coriacea TaxID=1983105 RepID=UPI003CEF861D
MSVNPPDVLALDFDGVVCDGLTEYFQSAWQVYVQLWQPDCTTPEPQLSVSFSKLRPVIETGWEMPVLLRALIIGVPEATILQDWAKVARQIVESEQLDGREVSNKLDRVRDTWIQQDLEEWLALHRFYPGTIAKIQQTLAKSTSQLFIITTKEGRFARRLLQQQGIELPPSAIIGKEAKRPKYETLRQIIATHPKTDISVWFVEDRLKTLQSIAQQPDLSSVRLYLADWGYNTERTRASICNDSRISGLSLQQFAGDFSSWLIS